MIIQSSRTMISRLGRETVFVPIRIAAQFISSINGLVNIYIYIIKTVEKKKDFSKRGNIIIRNIILRINTACNERNKNKS